MTRTIADYPQVTQQEVQEAFEYHAESGMLIRVLKGGMKKMCGTPTPSGEIRVYWHGTFWPAQLLVWIHQLGWPAAVPMHRTKDRSNNNMTNLRLPATIAAEKAETERAVAFAKASKFASAQPTNPPINTRAPGARRPAVSVFEMLGRKAFKGTPHENT